MTTAQPQSIRSHGAITLTAVFVGQQGRHMYSAIYFACTNDQLDFSLRSACRQSHPTTHVPSKTQECRDHQKAYKKSRIDCEIHNRTITFHDPESWFADSSLLCGHTSSRSRLRPGTWHPPLCWALELGHVVEQLRHVHLPPALCMLELIVSSQSLVRHAS
jgi:hypothetical protein